MEQARTQSYPGVSLTSVPRNASQTQVKPEALIVLVGITASWRKRRHLRRYLQSHCDVDVFVPSLPYRKPLGEVAAWFSAYLCDEVKPQRYEKIHCIAYIAAGSLLRCMPHLPLFERMVYFRGPYQELVAPWLVQRIGRFLAGLIAGKTALDLANGWPARLPQQKLAQHEALIIEEGRSRMARLLGITSEELDETAWSAAQMLPSAEAVLRVPESHDDVYTSDAVLSAALGFIQHGAFPSVQHVTHANAD